MSIFLVLILQLLAAVAITAGELAIGARFIRTFSRRICREKDYLPSPPLSFLCGLFLHCYLTLELGCFIYGSHLVLPGSPAGPFLVFGTSAVAFLLPWLFSPAKTWFGLKELLPEFDFNFGLFFTVLFFVGCSLFDSIDGISTPWINNYGDLTFHIGTITSFIWGENFPPQYPIFAGSALSYPFYINLWSANLWWPFARFDSLDLVFLWQWLVIWVVIFKALQRPSAGLLPWALLFGGGAYPYLYKVVSSGHSARTVPLAHGYIDQGYPWVPFISTIWVTQRPMILGIAVLLVAVKMFLERCFQLAGNKSIPASDAALDTGITLPFLLLALGLLGHVHTALVGGIFCLMVMLFYAITGSTWMLSRKAVFSVAAGAMPAILALPFFWQKHSIISFSQGWMPWDLGLQGVFGPVMQAAAMWGANAAPIAVLFIWLFLKTRHKIELSALFAIFVLCNFVQFAVWNWDQIKMFVALYGILLVLIAVGLPRLGVFTNALLIALIIPGGFESIRSLAPFTDQTVYKVDDQKLAEEIREFTKPNDIVSGKPLHNSPITLSGRRMYLGYTGTLSSHGLQYQQREREAESIVDLQTALTELAGKLNCSAYILTESDAEAAEIQTKLGSRAETVAPQLLKLHR